jgi:hypothetical protein
MIVNNGKIAKKKNIGGRPRKHDREQIANDMIKWAEKFDSINVNKFCALYKPPFSVRKLSEWSKEDDNFRESYDIVKSFLAFRREEWVSQDKLHVKAYDLSACAYDHIIKEEKRQQAEFESALKEKELIAVSESDNKRFDDMMNQIKELQSERSMERRSMSDAQ